MKLTDALSKIHAPKGQSTVIGALLHGDFDPIREQSAVGQSRIQAKAKLEGAQQAQSNCKSDWAYWGYEGDVSYWGAVVDLLTAAELVGPDELPDVPAPNLENKVVMDCCASVRSFGKEVLEQAKRQAEDQS